MKQRIGLVGVGNMGTSILEGALRSGIVTHSDIMSYDKIRSKAKVFFRKNRVHVARDIRSLCQRSDVLLLAIKPQDFPAFASENKPYIRKGSCVISILAGLTTQTIRKALGNVTVVRAMPNLGAKVGESMTVLCGQDKKCLRVAEELFRGCGEVAVLPEKAFDTVTAVSGSGPAYFFHLMELLTAFGVKQKIPVKTATRLAVQTALGAALLAKAAKVSCAELRQMVTSKKGTTEAALKHLEKKKFAPIFHSALRAAARRSRQLRGR